MSLVSTIAQASGPNWHEFDVAVSDSLGFGKERVAVLLHARINEVACRVQLDTGAASAFIWHKGGGQEAAAEPVQIRVQIGDVVKVLPVDAGLLKSLGQAECGGVIGTVGNGFFDDGTLYLDLGRERFAFVSGPGLVNNPAAREMQYLRVASGGGHPLVPLTLANGAHGQVLLDTGSMRFGLVATDEKQWRTLAGGPPNQAPRIFSIGNALESGALTCQEMQTAALMTLAGKSVRQEMLTYCSGKRFQLKQPLLGVLGLRALDGRTLVIDYVSNRWTLGEVAQ